MIKVKSKVFAILGIIFWTLTAIFVLLPSWPHIYYRLSPQASSLLASTIASTAVVASETVTTPPPVPTTPPSTVIPGADPESIAVTPPTPLPDVDPSLPPENGLIIDKIGVRGEIHEGEDWQTILKQGIWRIPDFATPIEVSLVKGRDGVAERDLPIILAAHRWGYLEWSASFRKLNSFYHLPELKAGDTIKVVWDQRPFEYKVYSTETGTEISDYSADLILYTCQLWNSPVRFFVYANRVAL